MATLCLKCGDTSNGNHYRCVNCGSDKVYHNLKVHYKSD